MVERYVNPHVKRQSISISIAEYKKRPICILYYSQRSTTSQYPINTKSRVFSDTEGMKIL